MINKNFYRKTNDKKILHKVGKQWKVISVALLMAVAGGAVAATHANANADAVNDQPYTPNQARINNKPASAKSAAPKPASQSVTYYPAASGSAAMYFDKVTSDNAVAAKNYDTVNAYVQSLNNEYNPQVNSFSAKSASASNAAKKDASLASSYSAVNNNPATAKTVNSLAIKNHFANAQLYQGMVQGQEEGYSNAVSSASNDVKAASDVQSLVGKLAGTDLSANSLNTSASAVLANSNLDAARSARASVYARYGKGDTAAAQFINVANRLSAGATTLNELPNNQMYAADVDQLAHNYNATQNASLGADLASDTNNAVSSATYEISSLASAAVVAGAFDNDNVTATDEFNALNSYAGSDGSEGTFNHFVASDAYAGIDFDYAGANQSLYNAAVSAAANPRLAGALESVAASLYGEYNPEYANSTALSKEASAAEQSADNAVTAASYADAFANANSSVVSAISNAVANAGNTSDAAAKVVNEYLHDGVTGFEEALGIVAAPEATKNVPTVSNYSKFETALENTFSGNQNEQKLVTDLLNNGVVPSGMQDTPNNVKNALANAAQNLAGIEFDDDSDTKDLSSLDSNGKAQSSSTINNTDVLANVIAGAHIKDTLPNQTGEIPVNDAAKNLLNGNNVLSDAGKAIDSNIGSTIDKLSGVSMTGLDHIANEVSQALNDAINNVDGAVYNIKQESVNSGKAYYADIDDKNNTNNNSTNTANTATANKVVKPRVLLGATQNPAHNSTQHPAQDQNNNTTDTTDATTTSINYDDGFANNNGITGVTVNYAPYKTAAYAPVSAALLSDGINLSQLESESGAINNVYATAANAATSSADIENESAAEKLNDALSVAASSANSALNSTEDASAANSTANDDDVTLASYFATSYSNAGNSESTVASNTSSALNDFFKSMANDPTFTSTDDAYANAEAAAANDKEMGVEYSKNVFNNSPHFLDVLKGAKLHSSFDFGSNGDKVLGSVNKGDRLTVLGVNFNRNGLKHGATRYLVLDNNTKQKGFFTGQPQFSKGAYLPSTADTADVNVKTLKPVTVYDSLNGGKAVKTIKAGTVVPNVTVVRDNPANDAMGYTKVETAAPVDDFFTANTDYVEILQNQPANNQPANNYAFNLSNVQLAKAYNNESQY